MTTNYDGRGRDGDLPLQDELLDLDRLREHARALAASLPVGRTARGRNRLDRHANNAIAIGHAYQLLTDDARHQRLLSPAADWMLDNHHLVMAELRALRRDLPEGYYDELPTLSAPTDLADVRVYALALELLRHTDSRLDRHQFTTFLNSFQSVTPLAIGELWAWPSMVRLALIENLRRLADQVVSERADRLAADGYYAGFPNDDDAPIPDWPAAWRSPFVAQLLHRIREQGPAGARLQHAIDERLAARDLGADAVVRDAHQQQAATQLLMANVVTSLRLCATIDWGPLIESVSVVDRVLRQDPSGAYPGMDFQSRDRQRQGVERIAVPTGESQVGVAVAAVERARRAHAAGERRAGHVGDQLVGVGRAALEAELGLKPSLSERGRRFAGRHAAGLYLIALAAATAALLAIPDLYLRQQSAAALLRLLAAGVLLIPASEVAVALVNRLVAMLVPPDRLPRLDFSNGIPAAARTMVVVPTLFSSAKGVAALLEQLEIAALGNPDPHIHFAILSDFADAPEPHLPADAALLQEARAGIARLNSGPWSDNGRRFFLFHRERRWNAADEMWMGWERKRGKLEEFTHLLRGATDTSFVVTEGALDVLPSVRYCLTLDTDTRLPREAARTLIGIAEHPLNRPVIDPVDRRVVAGYGMLQPRVSVTMSSAAGSPFARLYAGHTGVDPYTTAVSDVYQDLFGEGSFVGKGLFDVDAFHTVLEGRVPENAILSHDLFEGLYARTALVSDVELVDDYPSSVLAHARRLHRWVRGDWQILWWLLPYVPLRSGIARNRLPLISRWKIFDNLRRSLVAPTTMAALLLGWTVFPGHAGWWTCAGAAAAAAPLLVRLGEGLVSLAHGRIGGLFWRTRVAEIGADLARVFLQLMFTAQTAYAMVHAIGLTLVRLVITRRRLLEWETAAASATRVLGTTTWSFVAAMGASPTLGGLSFLVVWIVRPSSLPVATPFALTWILAPLAGLVLSRPSSRGERPLAADDADYLRQVAADTWRYFETYQTAEHHGLPPDNVQLVPEVRVAPRTSPTNIGMGMLAALAACDLDVITVQNLAERIDATLTTVEGLEQFRGHLLNWYDTQTLAPLMPAYVSTVDSGNLAGALMTLASGLHEHAHKIAADDALVAHLHVLAQRASAVVEQMAFDFLYDPQRQLFAVGYRLADADGPGRLDASYYDLLASEARLASFVAIAKGDVPAAHWFRLGRSVTNVHGAPVLLSWSATMFEYLMPSLVLRVFPGTLLEASCRFAVRRQIDYGRERDVPWGISESAYALMDRHDTYQYKAFGVPGLGLARGIGDELVVAPYATALAALVAPVRAIANLRRLEGLGARGALGFFEAIDYTARDTEPSEGARPQAGRATVVRAYMSHHQAMSVVACANAVLGDVMVGRFHRDPRVAATEMLLQERAPHPAPTAAAEPVVAVAVPARVSAVPVRRYRSPHTAVPHAQFLSNGRYTTVVTNGGGGASTWNGRAVTRWRRDATRDPGSHAVYLRDVRGGATWSAAYQPTMVEPDEYGVTFHSDKACFVRRDGDIASQLDIAVSPEDDVEVRRLTLRNRGMRGRDIEVTSYAELALTAAIDDLAHPAFGKLFVETQYSPENTAILCHRRPRSGGDELWAVHVLSLEGMPAGATEWETDRERFIGRGRGLRFPRALDGRPLTGTTGVVLDAICSLRQRVRLAPAGHVRLSFSTGVAPTREAALALAQKYHHPAAAGRAFALAFSHARSVLHHLGASPEDARLFERLASCLLYVDESGRSPADLEANTLGQSGLWRHGISGDAPILLVRAGGSDGDLALVAHVVQAQEYWRLKGLRCDVVIVNEHPIGYLDEMQASFVALLDSGPWRQWQHQPGGVYLLRRDHLHADERILLAAVARVVLTSDAGDLGAQLDLLASRRHAVAPGPSPLPIRVVERPRVAQPPEAAFGLTTGLGGFSPDGRAFIVPLTDAEETPQPWVNVIATPHFGTVVTASGSAFTWALNSRENRLTPFANDPVVDPTAEALFIRDDESGVVITPTPGPRRRRPGDGRVDVRHEPGRSSFTRSVDGLDTVLEVLVDVTAPVKISRLRLTNTGATRRQLSLFAYNDWALGPPRDGHSLHVVTSYDGDRGAVLAHNHFNEGFSARVAFLAASAAPHAATADRGAFFGRHGSFDDAVALTTPMLRPRFGAGLDPCAALQVSLTLAPGESREVAFLLGQGDDENHARQLIDEFRPLERTSRASEAARARWTDMLDVVQVKTPDDSFDVMMNGWLLYQTLSCRIDARTGYFQPGGAFGFRDQLQDVLALCHARPDLTRAHLLRAASRQYVEGDVQHWWHETSDRGLRSRCSDDLLWLPYCVSEYVSHTGDRAVLDERIPYLTSAPLADGEVERYEQATLSGSDGTLFEHCVRAIARGTTAGAHGLPLFGAGDWNDGMNNVGHLGRGESTWLGFFLHEVKRRFAALCDDRGERNLAEGYRREAAWLGTRLEAAWDGEWYRRGYYDDGSPLGSSYSDECQIDSIAQSWAVLSGAVPKRYAERAIDAVRSRLISRGMRAALLLTPAFDRTAQEPGYIKGYPPGLRENGGQYTHAAAWLVMALAALDSGDEAMELFHMLNPVNHSRTPGDVERYKLEPYVMAGDVYTNPMHPGRGGWSWYTGSAAWMYRVGLEQLLGLKRQGGTFAIAPCIPADWPSFSIRWRVGTTTYEIAVENPRRQGWGVAAVLLDGQPEDATAIPLVDDGRTHRLAVTLGPRMLTPA